MGKSIEIEPEIHSLSEGINAYASNEIDVRFVLVELTRLILEDFWSSAEECLKELLNGHKTQLGGDYLNNILPYISARSRRILRKKFRIKDTRIVELVNGLNQAYLNMLYSLPGISNGSKEKQDIPQAIQELISRKRVSMFAVLDILHRCSIKSKSRGGKKFKVSISEIEEGTLLELLARWGIFSAGVPLVEKPRHYIVHPQEDQTSQGATIDLVESSIPVEVEGEATPKAKSPRRKKAKVTIGLKKYFLNRFEELRVSYSECTPEQCLGALFMSSGDMLLANEILACSLNLEILPRPIRSRIFTSSEDSEILGDGSQSGDSFPINYRTEEDIKYRISFLTRGR